MAAKRRACKAKTKAGKRCKAAPLTGDDHCLAHSTRKDEVSPGFGGPQAGSGRPRVPRATDLMRERAAGRADVLDALYERGMTEAMVVAKYEGEVHVSDVPDLGARITAAERYLDRIEGKPRQAVDVRADIDGSETGGPLVSIVAIDASDPETRRLAHELLARQAGRAERDGQADSPVKPSRARVGRRRKSPDA